MPRGWSGYHRGVLRALPYPKGRERADNLARQRLDSHPDRAGVNTSTEIQILSGAEAPRDTLSRDLGLRTTLEPTPQKPGKTARALNRPCATGVSPDGLAKIATVSETGGE